MKFNKNEFGWKEKVSVNTDELPDDISIKNSLTVGSRIGDIGEFSVAEGYNTTASTFYSHAEGYKTTANGECSHAEGTHTTASGHYSHAEGYETTASGYASHAEGESSNLICNAISDFSPSTSDDDILTAWNENYFSLAKGEASHVEGKDGLALGNYSHAEGSYSIAIGVASHVEGLGSKASGGYSHAEGNCTIADGMCSHAEGEGTEATGNVSHAEGSGTKASSEYQHVQGKYNIEDTTGTYAHIVGNGTYNYNTEEEVRSNAHTLDWNGNAWYQGKLSQDGTPTEDKDLTTKKYVDDAIANQPQISFDTEGNLVVTIGGVTKKFKEITE